MLRKLPLLLVSPENRAKQAAPQPQKEKLKPYLLYGVRKNATSR